MLEIVLSVHIDFSLLDWTVNVWIIIAMHGNNICFILSASPVLITDTQGGGHRHGVCSDLVHSHQYHVTGCAPSEYVQLCTDWNHVHLGKILPPKVETVTVDASIIHPAGGRSENKGVCTVAASSVSQIRSRPYSGWQVWWVTKAHPANTSYNQPLWQMGRKSHDP